MMMMMNRMLFIVSVCWCTVYYKLLYNDFDLKVWAEKSALYDDDANITKIAVIEHLPHGKRAWIQLPDSRANI